MVIYKAKMNLRDVYTRITSEFIYCVRYCQVLRKALRKVVINTRTRFLVLFHKKQNGSTLLRTFAGYASTEYSKTHVVLNFWKRAIFLDRVKFLQIFYSLRLRSRVYTSIIYDFTKKNMLSQLGKTDGQISERQKNTKYMKVSD